jgi:predicted Ser/Thr protein kinase
VEHWLQRDRFSYVGLCLSYLLCCVISNFKIQPQDSSAKTVLCKRFDERCEDKVSLLGCSDVTDLMGAIRKKANFNISHSSGFNLFYKNGRKVDTSLEVEKLLQNLEQFPEEQRYLSVVVSVPSSLEGFFCAKVFLERPLPDPDYSEKFSLRLQSNHIISGRTFPSPTAVDRWDTFRVETQDWLNKQNLDLIINTNLTSEKSKINTERGFQSFIRKQFLESTSYCNSSVKISEPYCCDNILGDPNLIVILENNLVVCTVEITNPRMIPNPNLYDIYVEGIHESVISAINKAYHNMRANQTEYGILTTYELTFFLKRKIVDHNKEVLYITDGIPHNSIIPTVRHCLLYLYSLMNAKKFQPNAAPPTIIEINHETSHINVSEGFFKFDQLIRNGSRSKVFLEEFNGSKIVIKVGDATVDEHFSNFKNEVDVYELLRDLQGVYIPKVKVIGTIGDDLHFLGISFCGEPVSERINKRQKRSIKEIFNILHLKGITHNDIDESNILSDGSGRITLIDFDMAKINATDDEIEDEKYNLMTFLESF